MADTELGGDPVQMNDLATGYLAKKAAETTATSTTYGQRAGR
nr:hypothetical protein [Candidatus Microthrix sp.]